VLLLQRVTATTANTTTATARNTTSPNVGGLCNNLSNQERKTKLEIKTAFEKSVTGKLTQKGKDDLIKKVIDEINSGLTNPLDELQKIVIDLAITKAVWELGV
jgi:hypothetical protein